MDLKALAAARYSCRHFSDQQITKAELQEILEIGALAPTAKNLQEQRIYVIQSAEGLAKVDQVTPCRYGAPTVLLIAYDKNDVYTYPDGDMESGAEDVTIVTTHMMLAAKNLGIETCWLNHFKAQLTKELFGLPENEIPVILLDVGYAREDDKPSPKHASRKPLEETVKYL